MDVGTEPIMRAQTRRAADDLAAWGPADEIHRRNMHADRCDDFFGGRTSGSRSAGSSMDRSVAPGSDGIWHPRVFLRCQFSVGTRLRAVGPKQTRPPGWQSGLVSCFGFRFILIRRLAVGADPTAVGIVGGSISTLRAKPVGDKVTRPMGLER